MSASRVGKWRYRVPGPTPDCLAMSSRLAFAPSRVKACLAISRMRWRLRRASVRGFRAADFAGFVGMGKITCNRRLSPLIYEYGDHLRFYQNGDGPSRRWSIKVYQGDGPSRSVASHA